MSQVCSVVLRKNLKHLGKHPLFIFSWSISFLQMWDAFHLFLLKFMNLFCFCDKLPGKDKEYIQFWYNFSERLNVHVHDFLYYY